jgi:hypothetical protein
MTAPANTPVYETELASFWLDEEGILNSISRSPTRTIANTTENFEMVKRITNHQKVPLLIYLSKSGVPDKETRAFVARELPNVYKAMAMVSQSGLGKIIMNVLFGLKPPVIPMKTFSSEEQAREWLRQYL